MPWLRITYTEFIPINPEEEVPDWADYDEKSKPTLEQIAQAEKDNITRAILFDPTYTSREIDFNAENKDKWSVDVKPVRPMLFQKVQVIGKHRHNHIGVVTGWATSSGDYVICKFPDKTNETFHESQLEPLDPSFAKFTDEYKTELKYTYGLDLDWDDDLSNF